MQQVSNGVYSCVPSTCDSATQITNPRTNTCIPKCAPYGSGGTAGMSSSLAAATAVCEADLAAHNLAISCYDTGPSDQGGCGVIGPYTTASGPSRSIYPYTACNPSQVRDSNGQCVDNPASKQAGPGDGTQPSTCKPITIGTGNKYLVEQDYTGTGLSSLRVIRTYNSAVSNRSQYDLSPQWSIDIDSGLKPNSPTTPTATVAVRPDGKALRFTVSGGVWIPDADITDKLIRLTSGSTTTGWRYQVAADNRQEEYDANGLLLQITDANGQVQRFSYSDGAAGIRYGSTPHTNGYLAPACVRPPTFSDPGTANVLLCVTDAQGRQLNFNYDGSGRLNKFADPLGQVTEYTFDTVGNLATVTYPDGKTKTYHYNESAHTGGASLPNALTGITDENNSRYATYQYDSTGKAIGEFFAGNVETTSLSFGTNATTVTDARGTARTYNFQTILGVQKSTGSDQPAGSGCAASAASLTYDANGNVSSRTDFNQSKTCYAYDMARNLETKRVEGLTSGAVCSTVLTTPPTPTSTNPVRSINTQWHSYWRLPIKVAEPLKLTTWVYNGDTYGGSTVTCAPSGATVPSITGGTQPIGVLCQKIEQATTDATGASGLSPTTTGTARTWTYTYNQYGQVLTADGPRTDASDTTTYTYYAANDASLGKRGNLATITNAAGQVTSIPSYDANGRPLTIVDPNNVTTTLTYDPRGRLTSETRGTEVTGYQYDGVGQLTQLTFPDGSTVSYTYDAAHRLTDISDALGNSVHYTLDAMGNRTNEAVKDPGNVLTRQITRAYDALNRLQTITGGVQ